jgi:hypothetical protein
MILSPQNFGKRRLGFSREHPTWDFFPGAMSQKIIKCPGNPDSNAVLCEKFFVDVFL